MVQANNKNERVASPENVPIHLKFKQITYLPKLAHDMHRIFIFFAKLTASKVLIANGFSFMGKQLFFFPTLPFFLMRVSLTL